MDPVYQLITVVGSGAGFWLVLKIIRWFQNDFVQRSRQELADAVARAELAERLEDAERRLRIRYELHSAHLEVLLTKAAIPFPTFEEVDPASEA